MRRGLDPRGKGMDPLLLIRKRREKSFLDLECYLPCRVCRKEEGDIPHWGKNQPELRSVRQLWRGKKKREKGALIHVEGKVKEAAILVGGGKFLSFLI